MDSPCVRVPRTEGEETRQALAEAGVLDRDRAISVANDELYLPVSDPEAVPDEFPVVDREVPERETPTTPADLVAFAPTYERVGDVVVIDEDAADRARELAAAIVDSDITAKTVLRRASAISGEYRVRDWEILHGEDTETVHREYGFEYALDLASVYFTPRLATERRRVTEQVGAGERVFDMFAGVGPYAIPAAAAGAEVVAVDSNPTAVEYCRANARRNDVADQLTVREGDVRDVATDYQDWADRIIMNLPHSAGDFLETAVDVAGQECMVHYYDIQHEDDPFGPGIDALTQAAGSDYEVSVETERVVRSYAPHEVNICLDVCLSLNE